MFQERFKRSPCVVERMQLFLTWLLEQTFVHVDLFIFLTSEETSPFKSKKVVANKISLITRDKY